MIHAVVLGGGLLWTLLRKEPEVRTGEVLLAFVGKEPQAWEDREEELPIEEPPEVEVHEPDPVPETVPPLDELPPVEDLPPLEEPPLESSPSVLQVPVDIVDKRTRPPPEVRPPPAAPTPPAAAPPPPPRPVGARMPLRPLRTPLPPFPRDLVPPGTSLVLWLTYTINPDGTIRDAVVTTSSGYPAVDAAVRDFVLRNWRYVPPAVTRRVERRFLFEPTG